jgi:ubiquinone/menaquinone biosynthesis C-methylase UbiE
VDHFKNIYATQAKKYHQMIAPEDVDGNLLSALQKIVSLHPGAYASLKNCVLLDLGSGTGRIPLLVHDLVSQVIALDLNYPMLMEQKMQQPKHGAWSLIHGDNRNLPFPDNWVDVVTAGWAIGHLRGWYEDDWQIQIGKILTDMERVSLHGGTLVIIETLTTGALEPAPPSLRRRNRLSMQYSSISVTRSSSEFCNELAGKLRKILKTSASKVVSKATPS